ncbi:MAG: NUDIX domain-containing protein [Chloroflexi bacterium]|uniref:NUDIX domain-containing protein n=1 Tax=Candidatus Chlorohelix allophototropha TaxID=3003348 RepID=A0A8T7M329_9CHLR|nr:NUDIX domain-containing protein [Chloroflexota bacterium]WJW67758.1 NUDIX domain-containing protein [Chloroflexota bacterium L227-S17]
MAKVDEERILNQWDGPGEAEDVSAGGVVFRRLERDGVSRWQIAMMRRTDNGGWDLPKGHLENGENHEQAALREVNEEVGLEAEIVLQLGESRYIADTRRGPKRKLVVWYLMRATPYGQNPRPQPGETVDTNWIDLEGAIPLAVYPTARVILLRARRYLESLKEKAL